MSTVEYLIPPDSTFLGLIIGYLLGLSVGIYAAYREVNRKTEGVNGST